MPDQTGSGADLARQALAAYKATAPKGPAKTKPRSRTRRTDRGNGRDPVGFGALLGQINTEQGWGIGLSGGSILDRWVELCPQYAGHIEPAGFDPERGRLDLRPASHAYAAQLRLLGGQLAKQINDKLGSVVVRTIRVLPVGALATNAPAAVAPQPVQDPPQPGPVRTRETASPGYQRALEAALTHKPATGPTNPHVAAAITRQNQVLADPARREPATAFTDAVAALEAATASQPADSLAASIQAAREFKHHGDRPVRRAFDVA